MQSQSVKPVTREALLSKIVVPFLTINLVASLLFLLWPIAAPIFCAEFCLLAVWSAWGPGSFWRRFGTCVGIGALLFASQLYLWIVVFSVAASVRVILVIIQWLFSTWILAQLPLWAMRYIWQWRITDGPEQDLERFSVNDNMIGITMMCVAFASCRWATEFLIEVFGPFGFETALKFYGLALAEIYMLIAIAAFGTFLGFRLNNLAAKTIPLIMLGGFFSVITGYIWFAPPERWFITGIIWIGTIMFAWAMILPLNYMKRLGYGLFHGKTAIGATSGIESAGSTAAQLPGSAATTVKS